MHVQCDYGVIPVSHACTVWLWCDTSVTCMYLCSQSCSC